MTSVKGAVTFNITIIEKLWKINSFLLIPSTTRWLAKVSVGFILIYSIKVNYTYCFDESPLVIFDECEFKTMRYVITGAKIFPAPTSS